MGRGSEREASSTYPATINQSNLSPRPGQLDLEKTRRLIFSLFNAPSHLLSSYVHLISGVFRAHLQELRKTYFFKRQVAKKNEV